jgi:hypothetical protein
VRSDGFSGGSGRMSASERIVSTPDSFVFSCGFSETVQDMHKKQNQTRLPPRRRACLLHLKEEEPVAIMVFKVTGLSKIVGVIFQKTRFVYVLLFCGANASIRCNFDDITTFETALRL